MVAVLEGTFDVQVTARPALVVSADGRGVVSRAGSRLLADLAERTTLTGQLSAVLAGLFRRRAKHDPGRVLVDLAVAVADGAECISDIAVLVDQPGLFGSGASDSTVWRLLDQIGQPELAAVAGARAAAREVAWAQRAATCGAPVPEPRRRALTCRVWFWTWTPRSWSATRRRSRPRRRSSIPSATTRSWRSWTTPGSFWPGCCGRATPARTLPPTTSPSSTMPSCRSRTLTGTVSRFSSAPTAPAAP